jgi:hypothetical protein
VGEKGGGHSSEWAGLSGLWVRLCRWFATASVAAQEQLDEIKTHRTGLDNSEDSHKESVATLCPRCVMEVMPDHQEFRRLMRHYRRYEGARLSACDAHQGSNLEADFNDLFLVESMVHSIAEEGRANFTGWKAALAYLKEQNAADRL